MSTRSKKIYEYNLPEQCKDPFIYKEFNIMINQKERKKFENIDRGSLFH